jgi:hypothetical protein
MKDIPNALWAAYFITVATILVIVILFAPSPDNLKLAVLGFGSNIVTGAFAYIQGKRDGADSVTVPPNPGSSTTVSVIPNQPGPTVPTLPAEPAQPKAGS